MITIKHLAVVLILILGLSMAAYAGDDKAKDTEKAPVKLKAQTHCPVMGGKINTEVYTDIQGQRVYHCCAGCSAPLKKDPDKYFQKAAAEGVLFENIQTTCPVSGEELTKDKVALDYEGRHLYFCCEGCIAGFKKDPQKFLAKLDETSDMSKKADKKMHQDSEDHSKHNH